MCSSDLSPRLADWEKVIQSIVRSEPEIYVLIEVSLDDPTFVVLGMPELLVKGVRSRVFVQRLGNLKRISRYGGNLVIFRVFTHTD